MDNGVEILDQSFDRLMFYIEKHKKHWVSCVSGLKQVIVVIHVSSDITNVTRALIKFLQMRQLSGLYGSEIQFALWQLQRANCVTCFMSGTKIHVTRIAPSSLKPFDFMIRNPYEKIDLQHHTTWSIRYENEHWLLFAGDETNVLESSPDIMGIVNTVVAKL